MLERRTFLKAAVGGAVAASVACRRRDPPWQPDAYRKPPQSRVAVLPARDYATPLADPLYRAIETLGTPVQGRRVVLKPNMVEFDPLGVINTHPTVVAAAIEAFRRLGAREVIVAEGPGHRRDTEYLLDATGLWRVVREAGVRWVDLNLDAVRRVPLPSRFTGLGFLDLPATVLDADLLVSMPKLKTHHWAGVTLSLKNMFGVVPGAVYGWPKNLLHWRGIPNSILDINAALAMPRLAIVDGIVGMEGNGPIQGEPRPLGAVVLGEDPVAVDATCARLMGIEPSRIGYLATAGEFLGNVDAARIAQVGERPEPLVQPFRLLDGFASLRAASA